jgi:hypothetical protein
MTEPLAWDEVAARLARVLGEPVSGGLPLTPGWSSRMTWAAHGERTGSLVVKARRGDRAYEKTAWCAARLPLLGARGYPVPAIIWHGMAPGQWHVTVQNRLPGYPLTTLDGRLLEEVLQLVEQQADAAIPADDRDFTSYIANVLFDDWDQVWPGSPRTPGRASYRRPGSRQSRPSSTDCRRQITNPAAQRPLAQPGEGSRRESRLRGVPDAYRSSGSVLEPAMGARAVPARAGPRRTAVPARRGGRPRRDGAS